MADASNLLFAHMIQRPEIDIDLAAAALLIAEPEYPGLDLAHYISVLDSWGSAAQAQPGPGPDPALSGLNGYLFEELGFHGNDDDYYDPRNSFLNEVMDRRVGIPITLSIVYMEVGRRLGLDLTGISFPGHFLVRYRTPAGDHIIDPYHKGARLDTDELEERLRQVVGDKAELSPDLLQPATKRQILTRMLNNLRGIYQRGADEGRERRIGELLALLQAPEPRPGDTAERKKGPPSN
jgi:regulator of sirC expression with transglutaminase-like and TPR domain